MKQMVSTCIGIPDQDNTREKHSFIFMASKRDWLNILTEHMEDPNEEEMFQNTFGDEGMIVEKQSSVDGDDSNDNDDDSNN